MKQMDIDVAIIGAGAAGLCAALQLQESAWKFAIFEASDAVGGRMKTDELDGFALDRGFQVFQTAYPEAQRWLNYDALGIKYFDAGAMTYYEGQFYSVYDPYRHPFQALKSALVPFITWRDARKLFHIHRHYLLPKIHQIFSATEKSTDASLRSWGFSKKLVQALIRPFFTGVFLEENFETSDRMFGFILKMFSEGYAALPAHGIQSIPKQLAAKIPSQCLHFNSRVTKVEKNKISFTDATGNTKSISARAIILATEGSEAARLLNLPSIAPTRHNSTRCLYFAAEKPPIEQPILLLNGTANGYVNSMCVPSLVNPTYGTEEHDLISVSVVKNTDHLSDEQLLVEVKKELRHWFKKEVRFWKHLRTYNIPQALPFCPQLNRLQKDQIKAVLPSIYLAGDYTNYPSLNGAMESGRLVANSVAWDLALLNQ